MRKTIVAACAAALLAGSLPVPAQAGKKHSVSGNVLFPAVFAQGTFDGCWGGLHRREMTASQGNSNGVFGYHFDVPKSTWGKPFKLAPTGGQGQVDLDLFLYSQVPPLEEWPNDPVNAGTPVSVDFQTRKPGGEKGKVPAGTTVAIVCMYAGPTHQGFNATFDYTAG